MSVCVKINIGQNWTDTWLCVLTVLWEIVRQPNLTPHFLFCHTFLILQVRMSTQKAQLHFVHMMLFILMCGWVQCRSSTWTLGVNSDEGTHCARSAYSLFTVFQSSLSWVNQVKWLRTFRCVSAAWGKFTPVSHSPYWTTSPVLITAI